MTYGGQGGAPAAARSARRCTILLLAALVLPSSSCVIDRSAERALVRGEHGRALACFAERSRSAVADYALEQNLRASAALAAGDLRTAREALVEAGRVMGSFPGTTPRQVAALIASESAKLYLGDPYEVVMNSLYLALVNLALGDTENARAAVKQGILADADSKEERFQGDVPALYLLDALLQLHGGDPELARSDLARVDQLAPGNPLADERRLAAANTVIAIDLGWGPEKIAVGDYGSLATFRAVNYPERRALLSFDGGGWREAQRGVDVAFQALTRGARSMDTILQGKAALKEGTTVAGAVLLDQALRTRGSLRRDLAIVGGGLLLLSALIVPRADTRHWHLLPGETHLWIGNVAAGLHTVTIDFLGRAGEHLPEYQQIWHYVPFRERGWNVYYFRAGVRRGFRRRCAPGPLERAAVPRAEGSEPCASVATRS